MNCHLCGSLAYPELPRSIGIREMALIAGKKLFQPLKIGTTAITLERLA